jgi:DNA phosphorothioation system restriction enzyme
MKLCDLPLKGYYRSDECNIVDEFYIPCLSVAERYQRAVGFFSSSALAVAAKGLTSFIPRGGRMQLVASPVLSPEDIEAIEKGYQDREALVSGSLQKELQNLSSAVQRERFAAMAWLISMELLDVRIAISKQGGIYHEKMGIFIDSSGDYVAFSGSPNESTTGLCSNFESVDVFRSWVPEDSARAERKLADFDRLWANQTPNLDVIEFPQAAKEQLLRLRPPSAPKSDPEESRRKASVATPFEITLRGYQSDAISSWRKAGYRGILAMATGSGKTITALAAAAEAIRDEKLNGVLILAPYRHLATQWESEARRFGFKPVLCMESSYRWESLLTAKLLAKQEEPLAIVSTNATMMTDRFQAKLQLLPPRFLVIGDEVHNLGAESSSKALPLAPTYRLGLSATPIRHNDEAGTERVLDYFGDVLQPEYGLREALADGVLTPYRYYPVVVELQEDEREQYLEISAAIARLAAGHQDTDSLNGNQQLSNLLFKRARIVGIAQNKILELERTVAELAEPGKFIIYCGDGSIESPVSGDLTRHVDQVTQLLGNQLGLRVAKYTAETNVVDRKTISQDLKDGRLDGLVSIRCLDEGVDIPAVDSAFILASSTNPRQYIQRRGRVLRRSPGKNHAKIFDFIVAPMIEGGATQVSEIERSLFKREFKRIKEFCELAQNGHQALETIYPILDNLNLLDQ